MNSHTFDELRAVITKIDPGIIGMFTTSNVAVFRREAFDLEKLCAKVLELWKAAEAAGSGEAFKKAVGTYVLFFHERGFGPKNENMMNPTAKANLTEAKSLIPLANRAERAPEKLTAPRFCSVFAQYMLVVDLIENSRNPLPTTGIQNFAFLSLPKLLSSPHWYAVRDYLLEEFPQHCEIFDHANFACNWSAYVVTNPGKQHSVTLQHQFWELAQTSKYPLLTKEQKMEYLLVAGILTRALGTVHVQRRAIVNAVNAAQYSCRIQAMSDLGISKTLELENDWRDVVETDIMKAAQRAHGKWPLWPDSKTSLQRIAGIKESVDKQQTAWRVGKPKEPGEDDTWGDVRVVKARPKKPPKKDDEDRRRRDDQERQRREREEREQREKEEEERRRKQQGGEEEDEEDEREQDFPKGGHVESGHQHDERQLQKSSAADVIKAFGDSDGEVVPEHLQALWNTLQQVGGGFENEGILLLTACMCAVRYQSLEEGLKFIFQEFEYVKKLGGSFVQMEKKCEELLKELHTAVEEKDIPVNVVYDYQQEALRIEREAIEKLKEEREKLEREIREKEEERKIEEEARLRKEMEERKQAEERKKKEEEERLQKEKEQREKALQEEKEREQRESEEAEMKKKLELEVQRQRQAQEEAERNAKRFEEITAMMREKIEGKLDTEPKPVSAEDLAERLRKFSEALSDGEEQTQEDEEESGGKGSGAGGKGEVGGQPLIFGSPSKDSTKTARSSTSETPTVVEQLETSSLEGSQTDQPTQSSASSQSLPHVIPGVDEELMSTGFVTPREGVSGGSTVKDDESETASVETIHSASSEMRVSSIEEHIERLLEQATKGERVSKKLVREMGEELLLFREKGVICMAAESNLEQLKKVINFEEMEEDTQVEEEDEIAVVEVSNEGSVNALRTYIQQTNSTINPQVPTALKKWAFFRTLTIESTGAYIPQRGLSKHKFEVACYIGGPLGINMTIPTCLFEWSRKNGLSPYRERVINVYLAKQSDRDKWVLAQPRSAQEPLRMILNCAVIHAYALMAAGTDAQVYKEESRRKYHDFWVKYLETAAKELNIKAGAETVRKMGGLLTEGGWLLMDEAFMIMLNEMEVMKFEMYEMRNSFLQSVNGETAVEMPDDKEALNYSELFLERSFPVLLTRSVKLGLSRKQIFLLAFRWWVKKEIQNCFFSEPMDTIQLKAVQKFVWDFPITGGKLKFAYPNPSVFGRSGFSSSSKK